MKIRIGISLLRSVVILLILASCSKKENDKFNKILNLEKYTASKESITYDIEYFIKLFDNDDTLQVKSKVTLIRRKEDTIFGGLIWYTIKDSLRHFTKYYDLKKLYVIDHNLEEVTSFETSQGETYPITNAIDGKILNIYFLKPERLLRLTDTSINKVLFKETNRELIIDVDYPDEEDLFDQNKIITVDKDQQNISNITFDGHLAYQVENNIWKIFNPQYNINTIQELESRFKDSTQGYLRKKFIPRNEEYFAPLSNGIPAPSLSGSFFDTTTIFNLDNYQGKIVVLDFWYRSCPPCIKAIPNLNKVAQVYKDKDVIVLGINPIDTQASKRDKLQEFIDYHKVLYPTVLVDRAAIEPYNIQVYPTLYILNKDAEIAYSKLGLDESNKVSRILDSLIKN